SKRLGIGAGMSVLLIGDGPVAANFAFWLNRLGASVYVLGRRESRLGRLKQVGAVLTAMVSRSGPVFEQASRLKWGRFDRIIDTVGIPDELPSVSALLAPSGAIGMYGVPHEGIRSESEQYVLDYDETETQDEVFSALDAGEIPVALMCDMELP